MTLSTRIAPHLPYLRRFSRALTGSQASGDAYVAATLEALIADISIFPQASADRIALYRLFCNLYKTASVQIPEPASEFAWEKQAARNLSHIAPCRDRHFFSSQSKVSTIVKQPKFSNSKMVSSGEFLQQLPPKSRSRLQPAS